MPNRSERTFFEELKRRNVFRVAIAFVVASWLILQIVDVLVPMLDLPEWVDKTILLMLIVSFPIALILAWALELTPEGVRLEKNVDRSTSITAQTGKKLNYIIIGTLVVALGISLYMNVDDRGETTTESGPATVAVQEPLAPSIAVLPFANRSADESDGFFVDGMHDDLLTQLAKIPALKVISRTSVLQYRDTEKPMTQIGEELGVATIVEGGVQRAGDRIRINMQLIRASTDEHIWAETYNRELTAANIFEIQEEVTARIASALHAELTPADQQRLTVNPTENLAAYEAYLLGRHLIDFRIADRALEAEIEFRRALALDPKFELAQVALTETHIIQNNLGLTPKTTLIRQLKEFESWANDLDSKSGEVYNVLAAVQEYTGNYELAGQYYLKATELSPEYALARHWLALYYTNFTGELDKAIQIYRDILEVDPLNEIVRANLSYVYMRNGEIGSAQATARKSLALLGERPQAVRTLGEVFFYGLSNAPAALQLYQQATQQDPIWSGGTSTIYAAVGDREASARWLEPHRKNFPDEAWGVFEALNAMRRSGDAEGIAALAAEALQISRDVLPPSFPMGALQAQYLAEGRTDDLLRMYSEHYPELLYEDPDVNLANIVAAVNLISIHRAMMDEPAAQQLAELILKDSKFREGIDLYGPVVYAAKVHAIYGRTEEAVAEISRLIDAGRVFFDADLYFGGDEWAGLRADPAFQALLDINSRKIEEQRSRIRQLEEEGKIARFPEELSSITIDVSSLIE
jgi:TolB-like protein/Tfp pilus assembly protein PilF